MKGYGAWGAALGPETVVLHPEAHLSGAFLIWPEPHAAGPTPWLQVSSPMPLTHTHSTTLEPS